jgi:hypothetical protein
VNTNKTNCILEFASSQNDIFSWRSQLSSKIHFQSILHSRIEKWALALTKFSLTYVPLKAMKAQIIANFLANYYVPLMTILKEKIYIIFV